MNNTSDLMQKIISLCKRRGFIYPSSEIYGGFSAIYDYGPYGVELANAIKQQWWQEMVQYNDNIVGLDSAIFMHPKIWEASGHVGGFSDPLTECKNCNSRLRVDHLLESINVFADEKMTDKEINDIFEKNKAKLECPKCKNNDFTNMKKFNLLVQSNLGNFTSDWTKDPVYLRGETCQGIYVNYKNILDSTRVSIPFGIAQIGKAFRNEITARQFIFRTREFEQMEMQYFTHPDKELEEYEKLRQKRWDFYIRLGLSEKNLQWYQHEHLVFYAKIAYDIEYNFPFGFKELEGIHTRSDYDLTQHSKFSNTQLEYRDPKTNEKYIPHIIESSVGVGRIFLAILCDSYTEEQLDQEMRVVMKIPRKLAPVKVAVFPLVNKLNHKAKEIYDVLKFDFISEYDSSGSIGKRYRRQDEIGTPYCVTIDFDTLENGTVTVRDRDTMKQDRMTISDLKNYLLTNIYA